MGTGVRREGDGNRRGREEKKMETKKRRIESREVGRHERKEDSKKKKKAKNGKECGVEKGRTGGGRGEM